MSVGKLAVLAVIILLVAGLALGLYQEYYVARRLIVEPEVSVAGPAGSEPPRPAVAVKITNPTRYDFEVDNLVLHVYVEGVEAASAERRVLYVPANHTVTLELRVERGALEAALRAAAKVLGGGRVRVEVVGRADVPVKLFGAVRVASVTVPFHREGYVEVGHGSPG